MPFNHPKADGHHAMMVAAGSAGQKKAREMWFLARLYDAQQALDMGLVNTVVPLERLEEETLVWCGIGHAPLAFGGCNLLRPQVDVDGLQMHMPATFGFRHTKPHRLQDRAEHRLLALDLCAAFLSVLWYKFRCREMLRNSPTALRLLKCALNAADDGHAGIQVPLCLSLCSH